MKHLPYILTILVAVLTLFNSDLCHSAEPGNTDIQKSIDIWERRHISKQKFDDKLAKQSLKHYFSLLDPTKLYFHQEDIELFERKTKGLADRLRKGDMEIAYDIYKVYVHRMQNKLEVVKELLDSPGDFKAGEKLKLYPVPATYAIDDATSKARWRKWVRYKQLVFQGSKDSSAPVSQHYHRLVQRAQNRKKDHIAAMFLTSVASTFGGHSHYSYHPESPFRIGSSLGPVLCGIGIYQEQRFGGTVIGNISPLGPASQGTGMTLGDQIISVGEASEDRDVDVMDWMPEGVRKLLVGRKGTNVRVKVLPRGSIKPFVITLTRNKADWKKPFSTIFDEKKTNPKHGAVGYVSLFQLTIDMERFIRSPQNAVVSTASELRKILVEFNSKSVEVVILDLRYNGDGRNMPSQAIDVAGLFLGDGPVLKVLRQETGDTKTYNSSETKAVWDGPLVVITNKFTRHNAEILASVLKDRQRALIIGDKQTRGLGFISSSMPVKWKKVERSASGKEIVGLVYFPYWKLYRVNGKSMQGRGVSPHISLPSYSDIYGWIDSDYPFPLGSDKVDPAKYDKSKYAINGKILKHLSRRSKERRVKSTYFQNVAKVSKDLIIEIPLKDDLVSSKKQKSPVIQWSTPMTKTTEASDGYLDEVLAITHDYLSSLRSTKK